MSEHTPRIIIADGYARTGKGTTMAAIHDHLDGELGRTVELIDQGLKFRVMGATTRDARVDLESATSINDFLASDRGQKLILRRLNLTQRMTPDERKEALYTSEMGEIAGRIGAVASSHEVAVDLLKQQVQQAQEELTEVVLIDGRSMKKYADRFQQEGIAEFVIGWFFKCDTAIAARRSVGVIEAFADMTEERKHSFAEEVSRISDRNRSDALRAVDPIREPFDAYSLLLDEYDAPTRRRTPHGLAHHIMDKRGGIAVVDTSYTKSPDDMTRPIVELTVEALIVSGLMTHEDAGLA